MTDRTKLLIDKADKWWDSLPDKTQLIIVIIAEIISTILAFIYSAGKPL